MQEMDIRSRPAAEGMQWFTRAWALFAADPAGWIINGLIYLSVGFVFGLLLPMVGGLVMMLINPVLVAGLLYAAHEQDQGRRLGAGMVFQAFRDSERLKPLLLLGLLQLLLSLLAIPITVMLLGGMVNIEHMAEGLPSTEFQATAGMLVAMLVVLVVVLLAILLFLYAVPLVMFEATGPIEAIKLSLAAGMANVLPLTVLGLVFVPLWLFAMLSFGLGFLLVIPLSFISIYTSYTRIFKPRFSIEELA